MASSLDALSKNLDTEQYITMQKHCKGKQFKLLAKKGVNSNFLPNDEPYRH